MSEKESGKGLIQENGKIFCNYCKIDTDESHFQKRRNPKKGIRFYCTKYLNKIGNAKDRSWKHNLKKYFKITEEIYKEMLIKHNYCCAICGKSQSELNKKLSIDHNHETNEIRGLLCTACNHGIGLFKEDISKIKLAINYLEKDVVSYEKDTSNKKYTSLDEGYDIHRHVKRRYGITYKDYMTILNLQGDCCGICKLPRKDYHKNMAVDHCHETGNIRGILCNNCNAGMGCLKDNPEILEKSIEYIKTYNKL